MNYLSKNANSIPSIDIMKPVGMYNSPLGNDHTDDCWYFRWTLYSAKVSVTANRSVESGTHVN